MIAVTKKPGQRPAFVFAATCEFSDSPQIEAPWKPSETHDQLPDRLIGFHDSMGFPNVFKAEHSGRLRLVAASRYFFGDGLKRYVREGELRRTEDEAAEESEVDAARH